MQLKRTFEDTQIFMYIIGQLFCVDMKCMWSVAFILESACLGVLIATLDKPEVTSTGMELSLSRD